MANDAQLRLFRAALRSRTKKDLGMKKHSYNISWSRVRGSLCAVAIVASCSAVAGAEIVNGDCGFRTIVSINDNLDSPIDIYNRGVACYSAKNYGEAVKCFRQAAEMGYSDAQYNLGYCYDYGRGVTLDSTEAAKWYTMAAEQGNISAQNNLAILYETGRGVEKNLTEAVRWYRAAAEQGDVDAQFNLAYCCSHGIGTERDYAEAARWYRKAAVKGNVSAQCNLGLLYEDGRGVEMDCVQAALWYRAAAEKDNVNAQFNLALLYEYGKGVAQDYDEAVKWYMKRFSQTVLYFQQVGTLQATLSMF